MMRVWTKRVLALLILAGAGCGAAFGQAKAGAELGSRIHSGELAVSTGSGRTDGVAWLRLAVLYDDAARYDDAEKAFRKATDLLKRGDRGMYADALDRMGAMYVERGKFAQAEAPEQKAFAIRQGRKDAAGLGRSYMHLALVAYGKHDMRGAETDAEMAVSLLAPEHESEPRAESVTPEEKMSALIDLALIRCSGGGCDAAIHDLNRALELAVGNYPSNSVPVGFVHFLLGYAHARNGDVQGGAELMKTGIDEMKTQMGWGHPTFVAALKEYRAVLMREGRGAEAGEVEESVVKLGGSNVQAGFLGMNALR
jgi:tetratricopeptide (TPR) repeat protein